MNYCYIGLLSLTSVGLVEPTSEGTNYRRVEMGPHDWYFEEDVAFNAITVMFPVALSNWGVISHFGIFDSLQGGKLLAVGSLEDHPLPVGEGELAEFYPGNLRVSFFESFI